MHISIRRPPHKNNTSHQLKYTSFHLKYTSHSKWRKWRPPDTMWRPPDISGGRHLQNKLYILSEKMYISTGEMYLKYTIMYPVKLYISFSKWPPPDRNNTSLQLKYTSFSLKYTSHSLTDGRQIYLAAASYE